MACAKVVSDFELLTVEDAGRRRAWTDEDKVRIVEESLRGHRQGSATARRHGISRSLLTRWRSEYRAGLVGRVGPMFTPVDVTADAASAPRLVSPDRSGAATIEIVLSNGRRVIVPSSVDPADLARLLPVLERA
jgi:transposase-like protein